MDEYREETDEKLEEKILSKILSLLGIENIDMTDFDNRLKYQKLIFLVQNSGLSLGYGYNWYVRGPYSPPLTQDLFEIEQNKEIFEKGKTLGLQDEEIIISKIDGIKRLLGDNISDPIFLEVLASLIYIKKSSLKDDCGFLCDRLKTLKPRLKQTQNIEEILGKACKMLPNFGA